MTTFFVIMPFFAFCTHIHVKEGNYVWKMDQGQKDYNQSADWTL